MTLASITHVTKNRLGSEKDRLEVDGDISVKEFLGYLSAEACRLSLASTEELPMHRNDYFRLVITDQFDCIRDICLDP